MLMRTIKFSAVVILLTGLALVGTCSGCDDWRRESFRIEYVDGSITPTVGGEYQYRMRVRVYGESAVQEVEIENGYVLTGLPPGAKTRVIDYFPISEDGWEWQYDERLGYSGEIIDNLIYPSKAQGHSGAQSNNFLTSNEDGSFIAENYPHVPGAQNPQGRARDSRKGEAVKWRIEARADGVYVFIDGTQVKGPASPGPTIPRP